MKRFFSVREVAKLLGISKTAVLKQIQADKIKAEKVGNSYVIDRNELTIVKDKEVSEEQKHTIEKGIDKIIREYGETLRLLKNT